ncbi:predicted protein [Naegleria gruberi]|uniref:Predicted protein n=1 Tax=Naegleria gruberi TaxID=5762 RepID=D2W3J7_NAEGR|nr:uncharacterized protein NAEGRDRAFT_82238 [Naegleria gruberi]EFC36321.1 predicted protein [Naegleria gruberi]|eukprot:XP_002669065.1 predicted protein [Naegleria gruberi strain NEG-M]
MEKRMSTTGSSSSSSSTSSNSPQATTPSSNNNNNNSNTNNNNNNNTDGNKEQEHDENIQNGFYSISCLNCRKSHRSCNKQFPTCSDCFERNQECIYECPKKKGRKKGSRNQKTLATTTTTDNQQANRTTTKSRKQKTNAATSPPEATNSSSASSSSSNNVVGVQQQDDYTDLLNLINNYSPSSNQSTHQLIRRIYQPYVRMQQHFLNDSIRKRTVDIFFEVVGMGYDIISRPKLEQLAFDYMNDNIEEDGIFAKNVGFQVSATRHSAKAMLFAMQAMGEQRMGNLDLAHKAYMESRHQLTQSFDNIDNTYVKIAYGLLSCYLAGEGDDVTAHYYLNNLQHALERPATNNAYLLLETGDISEPERQAKHFNTFMLKQKVCLDHNNPQDLNIWEGFISMYTAKTHENPPQVITDIIRRQPSPQLLAVVDLIISVMNTASKLHLFTESQRKTSAVYVSMMNYSAKIAVLLTLGIQGGALLDNLADSVTALTDSDIFMLLPCSAIHYFAIAMNYRVKQFQFVQAIIQQKLDTGRSLMSIFEDQYEKHYFEMVMKDMKALTRMNTRFKRVEKYYSTLISNLKAILQWKSDRMVEIIQKIGFISEHIGVEQFNPYQNTLHNEQVIGSALSKQALPSSSFISSFSSFEKNTSAPTISQSDQQLLLDSLDNLLGSSANNDEFLNFDIPDFTSQH